MEGAKSRGSIRVLAAAVNTAATLTATFVFPEVPEEIWIAWGGVVMAGFGAVEAFIDR